MTSPEYYQSNKDKILQQTKEYYQRNKESRLEYQRQYRKENRKKLSERDQNKRAERLKWAIDELGGCCSNCSNIFDPICYDFHHVDPSKKDFTIGENMLIGKKRFDEEVHKCILLCANCHRLEHRKDKNGKK